MALVQNDFSSTQAQEESKKSIISKHSNQLTESYYIPESKQYTYQGRPSETIEDRRSSSFNGDTSPIVFPGDLSGDFYISFNAFKFSQDRFEEAKRNFSYEKSVYLPLPQSITDSFGASYTAENLYFVGNAIRNDLTNVATSEGSTSFNNLFSQGGMNRSASRIADYISSLGSDQGVRQAAAAFGVAALSNPNMGILGAAAKTSFQVTTNPYPVMIYSGTGFKSFSFEWTFYPEDASETETIKKIVGYFRREMLPEQDINNPSILKTPAIWEIVLKPDSHTKKFKRSVITGLEVNYTPNGAAFIFSRSAVSDPQRVPAGVSVRVNFQEIELWLANDFSNLEYQGFDYIDVNKATQPTQSFTDLDQQAERREEREARSPENRGIFSTPTNIGS
jgi:hypothetical protein